METQKSVYLVIFLRKIVITYSRFIAGIKVIGQDTDSDQPAVASRISTEREKFRTRKHS